MTASLVNAFNITDSGTLELDGAGYVTTAAIGGVTYVFVASRDDDGVCVLSLAPDGKLTPVSDFSDSGSTSLDGAFALTSVVVGGTTYLYTAAIGEYGLTGFSVDADGKLTAVANVADNATLQLALTTDVEAAVVGGTTYLFAGGANDSGISVFSVAADGTLTNVDNVLDDGTARIAGPQGMATALVDGTTYLFVSGFHDDGIGVYAVAANGDLTNVANVVDSALFELDGPVDVHAAVVGGTTYLFVTGFEDDGISVFSVGADGALTNAFNQADTAQIALDNPVGMSTAVLGGVTYLFVAGADDDGISVFAVGTDGALANVANVTDAGELELDRPIGVTTVVMNGQIHVIVGSHFDDGVSTFVFDDGINEQPVLTATGTDPTFAEGDAAVGLFVAATASTIEAGQTFTSLVLTVSNVTDGADEILSFLGTDLALTDGNSAAGTTVSVSGTTATVTFTGAFNAAALQQLIDSLAYRNASQSPTDADRVITLTSLTDSGGIADGGNDTASLAIASTVNVEATNSPAVITGDTTGAVMEAGGANNASPGTPIAGGNLDSSDLDGTNDTWTAVAPGTPSIGGYGTYAVTADGHWTYTLDDSNAAVQALNGNATLIDTFSVVTTDGTAQLVSVTIRAQNDAATVVGTTTGNVREAGGFNNDLPGTPIASGNLEAADVDDPADAWSVVAPGTASIGGYGTYQVTGDGEWTYALDNADPAVQALNGSATLIDTFNAMTVDGTVRLVTITILAQNDSAIVSGDGSGTVRESGVDGPGIATDTGDLDFTDVDNPSDTWVAAAAGTASDKGYGIYQLSAAGVWVYALDNGNAAVQALNGNAFLLDTFNALTVDGHIRQVSVLIRAANDAAIITGDAAGTVIAAGDSGPGMTSDSGNLDAADVDNGVDAWHEVVAGTATANGYGSYALTAAGVWTYTLDNDHPDVKALHKSSTLTDSFTALTVDGTVQVVTVTIAAQNDAPILDLNGPGGGTGSATTFAENGGPVAVIGAGAIGIDEDDLQLQSARIVLTNAQAGDVLTVGDLVASGISAAIEASVPGEITVTLTGAATVLEYKSALKLVFFNSTGESPATVDRIFEVTVNDGLLQSNTAIAAVAVASLNDAPVNTVPGAQSIEMNHALAFAGLAVSDLDAGAASITTSLSVAHGILTVGAVGGADVAGSGTGTVTLTGTVAQINAALSAAGNVVYRPMTGFVGADSLTVTTSDNGNSGDPGARSDTDVVAISVDSGVTSTTGTAGADSITVLPGNHRIDALGGIDTVKFDFRLVDASVQHAGNSVVIDGPGGRHTVLTGVERFVFEDGTVDNSDGDPLVDDLFYYAKYHDVWKAGADADAHYDSFGRHEGRDPSALFSTSLYLALNPDVRTSGADPLAHFDTIGWRQDRVPSLAFDPAKYLAANPDVAAAHVDPLRHYLAFGYEEGRQPFASDGLFAANGFDFGYYLAHNPDVAAAGVDPFRHFQEFGWKEGRDPNALFDVGGYLATYADVAAAGINPLDHYNTFGWREGRDPSTGFDTSDYLAAYPDVAAAQINPLLHYLQNGSHEGRSAFADGLLG